MEEWHNETSGTSETQTTHETGPHCRCCDLGGREDRQRGGGQRESQLMLIIS